MNRMLAKNYWLVLCRALWRRLVPVALRTPEIAEHGPMQCHHVTRHGGIVFWHLVLVEPTQFCRRHASITPLHAQLWLVAVAVRPPYPLLQFVWYNLHGKQHRPVHTASLLAAVLHPRVWWTETIALQLLVLSLVSRRLFSVI